MKVNQVPSTKNEQEERTEVLSNQEEERTKPATGGTGIPYNVNPSQSPTNTTLPHLKTFPYQNHENCKDTFTKCLHYPNMSKIKGFAHDFFRGFECPLRGFAAVYGFLTSNMKNVPPPPRKYSLIRL